LDHAIGPSNKFWKIFSKVIKNEFPHSVLLGEAWMKGISWNELKTIQIPWKRMKWLRNHSSDNVLRNYIGLLDGVLDFTAQELVQQYLCQQSASVYQLNTMLAKHYKKFPQDFYLPIFLDNHDMDRFLFQCNNTVDLLKKAAKIQFNVSQPKIIYYGTEQGVSQSQSVWSRKDHGDILARKPMPWDDKNKNNELFNFYRNLIRENTTK
jgi:hypothetical protein